MKLPLLVSPETLSKWKQVVAALKNTPLEPAARVALNRKLESIEESLSGDGGDSYQNKVHVYGKGDLFLIVKIKNNLHMIPDDRARVPIYKTKLMAEQAADQNGYTGEQYKIVPCKTIYIL